MPLTLVQLSSGFPGWNVGMEHLFNDSERLGKEHKCSRNGSNINFCLLVSICCSSGNDAWAGLCLLDTDRCDGAWWICLVLLPTVYRGVSLQPVQNSWEGPEQGTGHSICSLIQLCSNELCQGWQKPHSGGVNPCGSRTNSTGCWRVAVLELGKCHSPGRHRGDSTGLELGQAAGDTASSNISSAAASSSWCSLEKNRG